MSEQKGLGSKILGIFVETDGEKPEEPAEAEKTPAEIVAELAGTAEPGRRAPSAGLARPGLDSQKLSAAATSPADFEAIFREAGMDREELDRVRELSRQIEIQKNLESSVKDPTAQQIARKNVQVLQKRTETIKDIENFLARARGQMNLIENSVRLLRDQVLTMANPDELGEQLDDLITGVEAIQASAKEQEAIFSRVALEPIAPSADAGVQERAPGKRVRS